MKRLFIISLILILTATAFGQMPQTKPMLGVPISLIHPLGPAGGLKLFILGNEGSGNKAFDLSGNGNTLTINNDYLWSAGKFGTSVELLGVTDFITGDSAQIIDGMTAITMSIWFNTDSILAQMLIRLEQVGLTINVDGGTAYILYTPDLDGGGPGRSTYPIIAGICYHVVVTQDASNNYAIYVDGVLIQSGSTIALDLTGSERLLIGALNQTGTWDFDGKLDIPSIYNRALSASEIALLYREPFGMFVKDNVALLEAGISAPPGVVVTPYYYRGFIPLPFIFFTVYYLRRHKCAA